MQNDARVACSFVVAFVGLFVFGELFLQAILFAETRRVHWNRPDFVCLMLIVAFN